MKTICNASALLLLALTVLSACSKKNTPAPTQAPDISILATNWVTDQWGGINDNVLLFTIDKTTAKGTVDAISGASFGFSAGKVIFNNIKPNGDGTFSCSGTYNPIGSGGLLTRGATMSLQNGNTQLTVYYPALNSSYPAITYVYQQTPYTVLGN